MPYWHVDAFAEQAFSGNPAVVCVPDELPDDHRMQQLAAEFNQSETAFIDCSGEQPAIRWFTPTCEVQLCGHATLAAGAVWLDRLHPGQTSVTFSSVSGPLTVQRAGNDYLEVALPRQAMLPCDPPDALERGLGLPLREVYEGANYLVVLDDQASVGNLVPDMQALASLPERGCIITAGGDSAEVDFVSRFFAPGFGIPEDPVTGSAHCMLVPYWADRLRRERLIARQLSARGGELLCRLDDERVWLAGRVQAFAEGTLAV